MKTIIAYYEMNSAGEGSINMLSIAKERGLLIYSKHIDK